MPRIGGPSERSLELEVAGYKHEDTSAVDNDFDANWLIVQAAVADGEETWEARGPAFLTWELLELVDWLRAAAAAGKDQQLFFSGIEPHLQFEADHSADPPSLVAVFAGAFLPAAAGKNQEHQVVFALELEDIGRFADEIARAVAAFPVRVVQEGGFASKVIAERKGTT